MRKTIALTIATTLLVTLPMGTASARPAPHRDQLPADVKALLAGLAPGEMATVVVTLRDQAAPASGAGTRRARLRQVIETRQAKARTSQVAIRKVLRDKAAKRSVARSTPLWIVNGVSVTATADVIRELAGRADVARVSSDEISLVPTAVPTAVLAATTLGAAEPNQVAIGAPALWDMGFTGQSVVVANLDTGVDVSHPDLAARWRGGSNSWFDPYGEHPTTPTDLSGHGTATMGVMVGGDADGTTIGTAPGATWIAAKVFNDKGGASATALHQAFQWLLDPDHDPTTADAPHVVNASWSIGAGPGCDVSFQPDVQALRSAGILPVFAAGNFGAGVASGVSPANYPESLAVGAVNNADALYPASSRGPATCGGRSGTFPDVVAPGVEVYTAERYGMYQLASGTSLSAPHAAGALALLLSAQPGLSPDRQQAALTATAVDLGVVGPDTSYGNGRIDVGAARQWLQQEPDYAVSVSPGDSNVAPGATAEYTVQVTASNGFGGDVSLALAGLPAGQADGTFAPTVISGGSGSAKLTVTTASTITPSTYPLTVTATSGLTSRSVGAGLTVTPAPDFTITGTPATTGITAGASADVAVQVVAQNGFAAPVDLTAEDLPTGLIATFTPATLTGSGTAQLRLTAAAGTAPGRYPIAVTGTSGGLAHTVTVTVTVAAPVARDFRLSAAPATARVVRGRSATYTIDVASLGGFTGRVTLSRSGVPPRTSTVWSTRWVTKSGRVTMQLRTTSRTPRGTYTVTVTGVSGSITHRVPVKLVVS